MEKPLPPVEEKEGEAEEIEEDKEEETKGEVGGYGDDEVDDEKLEEDDEEKLEEDDADKGGRDEKEKEEEAMAPVAVGSQKTPKPAQPKVKKQTDVLNLNNEVVNMRKEVKRVRALTIRKLTRQIGVLKKKKGKEEAVEKNQRRAARVLEEIHAMKALLPDLVTKTALQKSINFEKVCKDPKSSMSDRAVARIATHPQFSKKIEVIKAAVKAFKEERMKDGMKGAKDRVQNKAAKVNSPLPDNRRDRKSNKEEKTSTVQQKEMSDSEEEEKICEDSEDSEESILAKPAKDTEVAAGLSEPSDAADVQHKELPEAESVNAPLRITSKEKDTTMKNSLDLIIAKPGKDTEVAAGLSEPSDTADVQQEELTQSKSVNATSRIQAGKAKDTVIKKPPGKDVGKKQSPAVLETSEDEEDESDLESSDDEEKEYFDDSTEERFKKLSSQSEESEDDFFVGKVSKFKKVKQKDAEGEKDVEKGPEAKKGDTADKLQSELDELEARLQSKASSVFYSSLSGSNQGEGRGRGRGGESFRGQRKPRGGRGSNRDFKRNSGSEDRWRESEEKGSAGRGRGRGRGRGDGARQMGRGGFSQQAPQQSLHPSWEASKKRKEQQGQILAFQGKKIKFDDDD